MVVLLLNASLTEGAVFTSCGLREVACLADGARVEECVIVGVDRHGASDVGGCNGGAGFDAEIEVVVREEAEQRHENVMGGSGEAPCVGDEESFADDLEE